MSELPAPIDKKPDDAPIPGVHQKITAEKIFDGAVYGGISYGAQALTGVALTYWLLHGKGRPHLAKFSEWVGNVFGKGKQGPGAVEKIKDWIVVTTMVMVGNAYLVPVRYLERRKPGIVRWINDKINAGHELTPEEHEAQEARLDFIEHHAPKQNWWSLGIGRGFALAAVYTVLPLIGTKNNERAAAWTSKTLINGVNKVGLKSLAKSDKLKQIFHISFYDGFYSMVSAGGLYVYSHFLHPSHKHPPGAVTPLEEVPADDDEPEKTSPASVPQKTFAARFAPVKSAQNWQTSVYTPDNNNHPPTIH